MNSYGKYKQIMCIQMGDVRHHLAILLYISFPRLSSQFFAFSGNFQVQGEGEKEFSCEGK